MVACQGKKERVRCLDVERGEMTDAVGMVDEGEEERRGREKVRYEFRVPSFCSLKVSRDLLSRHKIFNLVLSVNQIYPTSNNMQKQHHSLGDENSTWKTSVVADSIKKG